MFINLIIIFVILQFCCLNYFYKRTNFYKNQFLTAYDFMNEIPYNLKLAVFGSTYTKFAFNSMKKLRLNAMNFSLDAECLECDKELLDQYGKHISPGAVVIFSLTVQDIH